MTPKTRRVLLSENYSSQRARRWWAITSPSRSGLALPGLVRRGLQLAPAQWERALFFFFFFFLTPAAADRGAGASAQACCSVGRQTARTKGGGKRFTSQGAPHPAQRTFSPRIVWCPRHEPIYYSVQTVLGSRPLALSRQPSLPLSRRAAPPAPARRECDGISASG